MIRVIKNIKNIGLLADATAEHPLTLKKNNIIYAENGRGKSTVASILHSLSTGEAQCLIDRKTYDLNDDPIVNILINNQWANFENNQWDYTCKDILVFDSEFINRNVYSGISISPSQRGELINFALGEDAVSLKKEYEEAKFSLSENTNQLKGQKDLLKQHHGNNITLEGFHELQNQVAISQLIEECTRNVKQAENIDKLNTFSSLKEVPVPSFNLDETIQLFQKTLDNIMTDAESKVKQQVQTKSQSNYENWISDGTEYLSEDSLCPFCNQSVEQNSLISSYQAFFNKEYLGFKKAILNTKQELHNSLGERWSQNLSSTHSQNIERLNVWNVEGVIEQESLLEISDLSIAKNKLAEKLILLAQQKQLTPLEEICKGTDEDSIRQLNTQLENLIKSYNNKIRSINQVIDKYKEGLEKSDIIKAKEDLQVLLLTKKRFEEPVISLISKYESLLESSIDLKKIVEERKATYETTLRTTLDNYKNSVNKYIKRFYAQFTIENFKPNFVGKGESNSQYLLNIRDNQVKLKSFSHALSEADKRTLAFAFFLARLEHDPNLSTRIIVIDDPMSSMDHHRQTVTLEVIQELSKKCKQLIILSHDKYFANKLRNCLKDEPLHVVQIQRVNKNYSSFANCELEKLCKSDHKKRYDIIYDFVNSGSTTENLAPIAYTIRVFLEGYILRKYPRDLPLNDSLGSIISLIQNDIRDNPNTTIFQGLKTSITEIRKINDYALNFHHDTTIDFDTSDIELTSYAKKVLELAHA